MPEIEGKYMKYDSYEYWKEQLKKDEAQLKDLKEKGTKALCRYDIEIAHTGDAGQALKTVIMLKRNHITYDRERIAEHEAKGIQENFLKSLF